MYQYIILNNGILKLHSSVLPSNKGYISQYTPYGVYGLIGNEINGVVISLMIVKMIYCLYEGSTWDILNIFYSFLKIIPILQAENNILHWKLV